MIDLSIVIPVFNDSAVLPELYKRLHPVLDRLALRHEIILVDDGSDDDSGLVLRKLQADDYNIRIILLSRNFGQSNAIAAGLEQCRGNIVVVMDSDLEDRPEDIPSLLKALEENGVQMAIARRCIRHDPLPRRLASRLFFRIANLFTIIRQMPDLGVFRVFYRREYARIMENTDLKGTILSRFYQAQTPFTTIDLEKDKRFAGRSGYSFAKRIKLALDRLLPHLKHQRFRQERQPCFEIREIIEIRETK